MTAKHRQIDVFSGLVLLWTLGYAEGTLTLLLLTDTILGMTFPLLRLLSHLYTPKVSVLWIMLYAVKGFAPCEPFYYPISSQPYVHGQEYHALVLPFYRYIPNRRWRCFGQKLCHRVMSQPKARLWYLAALITYLLRLTEHKCLRTTFSPATSTIS
jgi:hypothetical protein